MSEAPPQQPQKICPIMSASTLSKEDVSREPPKIVAVHGKMAQREPTFVPCVGAHCAMYTPLVDQTGKVVGGGCSLMLFPQAVMGLQQTLHEIGVAQGNLPKEG